MDNENQMQTFDQSFLPYDPIVLLLDAARKWLLVVVIAVICGIAAFIYTDSGYVPVYRTESTLVLTTRDSSSSVYDKLNSTTELALVFSEILNSSVMRNNILNELGMDSFNGTIEASAIESTNLLTVRVTAGDPRTAFRVMEVLLEHHDMVTYEVMGNIVLEVLQKPVVPTYPANAANAESTMKKAMVLSAVAAYGVLVMVSYFSSVVRSKDEAEEKLDCWCLGEIRHERKKRTWKQILLRKKRSILITHPETDFGYVTTMSKLRRRVEQHMSGGKVLMVTSVMENEGKSTVSANLALAMSKKYRKVLLIDCDLHKPACRKIMDQEKPACFLNDVLMGRAALDQAVCTDKLSRMDMLFARHCDAQEAAELINSKALPELLRQAREQYDFVVIDLPPMAAVPDPETVMEYADGSLLVVRQNGARVTDLNRAIADLQRGKAKLLGCVLNNVYVTGLFSGEGYGTGYGRYGQYGKYGKYGKYGVYAAKYTGD